MGTWLVDDQCLVLCHNVSQHLYSKSGWVEECVIMATHVFIATWVSILYKDWLKLFMGRTWGLGEGTRRKGSRLRCRLAHLNVCK